MLFHVAAYNAEVTPSPTSPAYLPAGYCRCGYRTDPGVCPECGRVNRRMRRWDPKGKSAWRMRWGVRGTTALGLLAGLFLGGKHVLWNYWPLEQIQYLTALQRSEWWANPLRTMGEKIIDHRSRQMYDLAHARFRELAELPPKIARGLERDGRYSDGMSESAIVHGDEFLVAFEATRSPGQQLAYYGTIIQESDAALTVRIDWSFGPKYRIRSTGQRPQQTWIRALLRNTPVLVELRSLPNVWSNYHQQPLGTGSTYPGGILFPEDVAEEFSFSPHPWPLLVPSEYCEHVIRPNIVAYITEISSTPMRSLSGQAWKELATLNVGSLHGVRLGLEFQPQAPFMRPFRVTQVDETTCIAESFLGAMAPFFGRSLSLPEAGTLVRTVSDE